EKRPPAERIPTNAEAQSTTVTSAASDVAALPCILASSVHDVSVQAEASMRHPPTMSTEHRHLGDVDIAAVAALLGEPARAAMLDALMDGGIRPAGELARRAGIAPSTASGHLMRLLDGGRVSCETHGRQRRYRLASPALPEALDRLARLAPPTGAASLREAARGAALREARTCYDHLAGRLGVAVTEALVARKAL